MRRLAFLLPLLLLGCGGPESSDPPPPPPPFTEAELELQLLRTPPGPKQREQAEAELLKRKRIADEARERGFDREPGVLRAMDTILIQAWQEQVVDPQIAELTVTEEELHAAYEASIDRWTTPATVTVAHIFRRSRPEDTRRRQQDRDLLESLREEVADLSPREGFGSLAARHSMDQSTRYRDGVLSPLKEDADYPDWRAEALAASRSAKPGALLPLLETPNGLHLVRVVERHPARIRLLEAVDTILKAELLEQKEAAVRSQALRRLSE